MSQSVTASALAVLGDLGNKIDQLGDDEVLKIAALLERGGDDPKAQKGLAILRPRLRALRPRRRLDARRVFCMPFEMLLSDDQVPTDPIRRIARAAILPTWDMVAIRLPDDVLSMAEATAADAHGIRDPDLQRAAAALWSAAAEIIEAEFAAIAARVGDPQWLHDIGGALRAHESVAAMRNLLRVGGLPSPPEAQGKAIADLVHHTIEQGEDAAFITALVAAAHFRSPGNLVGALLDNKVGTGPGTGQAVLKRLCDALGADLDREVAGLQGCEAGSDPATVVAGLDNLASSLKALQSFAGKAKDRELKLKVEKALLAARSAAVDEVLPMMRESVGQNLDQAVSDAVSGASFEAAQAVEDNMTALSQARPGAEVFGVAQEVDSAVADLLATVHAKAAEGPSGESADDREIRVTALARYVELLDGPDAAQACLSGWLSSKAA